MGRYEGREAIREFFRGISGHFVFALHYGLNPHGLNPHGLNPHGLNPHGLNPRIAVSSSSKSLS